MEAFLRLGEHGIRDFVIEYYTHWNEISGDIEVIQAFHLPMLS